LNIASSWLGWLMKSGPLSIAEAEPTDLRRLR